MAPEPRLISCLGVEGDLALLPHFLRHYRALGVDPARMHIILNSSGPEVPCLNVARELLEKFGTSPPEIWIAPYTSDAMWAKRREIQTKVADPRDWVVSADVDEFHEYPETLRDILARCDRLGVNVIQGVFIDRLAQGGRLAPVRPDPDLSTQFPVIADVICSLGGEGVHHDRYGTVKLMAIKGAILPSRGGHHPQGGQQGLRYLSGAPLGALPGLVKAGFRSAIPLRVHHYHWTAGLQERLRRRLETPGASAAGREYGSKLLRHLDAHGGIDLEQVARPERDWRGRLPWTLRMRLLRTEVGLGRTADRFRNLLAGKRR